MTTISAHTILSSKHAQTNGVLSTILARYPRIIHSEMLTHRDKSRNSASSRAITIDTMIWEAENDYAEPLFWGKNQKGMQSYEELEGLARERAIQIWHESRLDAIKHVKLLNNLGIHKQVANRLLEPYIHITVLYSGTEWSNMMALRDHHAAEPHIQLLAKEFHKELIKPPMQILQPNDWHTPWVDDPKMSISDRIVHSVACNASTSYKTVDNKPMTPERANRIYGSLIQDTPIHASPAEHVAQADTYFEDTGKWANAKDHRNYTGFRQYRAFLPNDTL